MGRKNQRIRKVAGVVAAPSAIAADVEGEEGAIEEARPTDYLDGGILLPPSLFVPSDISISIPILNTVLLLSVHGILTVSLSFLYSTSRKHNKTDQDSEYAGTILGRPIDHGEVPIEGGPDTSLAAWAARMREATTKMILDPLALGLVCS